MNKILLTFFFFFLLLNIEYANSQIIDSLEQKFIEERDLKAKIDLAITISREINRLDTTHSRDFYYAELAVDLAESQDDDLQLAKSLDNLGLLHRFNQRYAQAIPLHLRAWELIKELDSDAQYKMRFGNNIGVAARYDQDYALAVKYYLEALKIAETENDLRNIAIASNGLGNSLSFVDGREDEAINYFMQALKTERERGNMRGTAMNLLSVGSYYIRLGEHDHARQILDELLEINQTSNDQHGLAITYEYFGHNYFEEGVYLDEAAEYFTRALTLFKSMNNMLKVADVHLHLGSLFETKNNSSMALNHYNKAMDAAGLIQNKSLIARSAERLSSVFEKTGRYKDALENLKLAEINKDSIGLIEQESVIQGLKMKYDFEKKENEINLLRANQEVQNAEIVAQNERFKKARVIYAFVFLVFLSITLLIILILRNLYLKEHIRLQEEEQKQERLEQEYQRNIWKAEILATRMQLNPHFLFNCLNSVKYFIQKNESRKAINYVVTLSRYIREILQNGKLQTVSLNEELELIKKYVELEASRFDQQLEFSVHLQNLDESMLSSVNIPPMILQPFVENAIWHGLVPSQSSSKKLIVSIHRNIKELVISLEDNGVGRSERKLNGLTHKGLGTKITDDRIALFNKMTENILLTETIDLKNDNQEPAGTRVNLYLRESRN